MRTNLSDRVGGGYAAPTIEMFEITTEKGFALSPGDENNSNPGGSVSDDWA